jgi:hypothetical protein
MKMQVEVYSETSEKTYYTTLCNIPEGHHLGNTHRENLNT